MAEKEIGESASAVVIRVGTRERSIDGVGSAFPSAMTGASRIVYMPNGLELAITEIGGGLHLESYKWRVRRSGLIMESSAPEEPSELLRKTRFETLEQLVEALRRALE